MTKTIGRQLPLLPLLDFRIRNRALESNGELVRVDTFARQIEILQEEGVRSYLFSASPIYDVKQIPLTYFDQLQVDHGTFWKPRCTGLK